MSLSIINKYISKSSNEYIFLITPKISFAFNIFLFVFPIFYNNLLSINSLISSFSLFLFSKNSLNFLCINLYYLLYFYSIVKFGIIYR